jgi:hypothetical protein
VVVVVVVDGGSEGCRGHDQAGSEGGDKDNEEQQQ